MPVIDTVNKPDQFLVQVNGSVRMIADEMSVTVAGAIPAGTVLEAADTVATDASEEILGILMEDKPTGSARVRVMVRGNPSSVNAQDLNYGTATSNIPAINALLEEKGIVVVNQ